MFDHYVVSHYAPNKVKGNPKTVTELIQKCVWPWLQLCP